LLRRIRDTFYGLRKVLRVQISAQNNATKLSRIAFAFDRIICSLRSIRRRVGVSVQFPQSFHIDITRLRVACGIVRIIQAISQVGIVEILVRVRQPQSVTELVAHGVQPPVVVGVAQVVFVHFGGTGHNGAVQQLQFVDAGPSRFAVIGIANLKRS